jgi:hypothetical protein
MILAMGVGIFIPPIGIGFYVPCSVSESRFESHAALSGGPACGRRDCGLRAVVHAGGATPARATERTRRANGRFCGANVAATKNNATATASTCGHAGRSPDTAGLDRESIATQKKGRA